MKGSVHVAIGASAPIGLVATQAITIPQGVVMAIVAAGYAVLPDVDTPTSCASRALGPLAHKAVHGLCRSVVDRTALRRDKSRVRWMEIRRRDPYHRSLTHTLAATLLLGCIALGSSWAHPAFAGFLAALGAFLLWPICGRFGLIVPAAAVAALGAATVLSPWMVTLAVTGGYMSHLLADACTTAGVPLFWPLEIQGKRWWYIRLLGASVTSGSPGERGPAVGVALASNVLLLFAYF
ncbi:metal-dependent hydrolase [Streptomyces sp. NEAU-Y11]|uniref:metal-dependent hydrolase n=1 Tax=Streptomyces cucumeris TaxID=2962890 RepID=UPI0035ABB86E